MDLQKIIKDAMQQAGISTKKELQELTGLTFMKIKPAIDGNKDAKLVYVEKILAACGKKLKVVDDE